MPIHTCFFDMGNVLVHFCHDRMCENVAQVAGIGKQVAAEILMGNGLQWQVERGEISEAEFHQKFQDCVGNTVDFEALKLAVADIFTLNASIVPLLDELRELGMRLVLLSNTSLTHLNFIKDRFDVLARFDALTTSFESGTLKPGEKIYADALSRAECAAGQCFYTDDIEEYVVKARTFGIHAEVYTNTETTRRQLRELGVAVAIS